MINLQSQVAGQNSEQLLPQAKNEALTEGVVKRGSGETFFSLMTEFLGLNGDQGMNDKQKPKLKGTGFDSSFDELVSGKPGSEIQLDLNNPEETGMKSLPGSKGKQPQTKELPDELLIQLSNVIQIAGGQDRLITTAKDAKANPLRLVPEGEGQVKKLVAIEGTLKVLNELLDGFQLKRSGESIGPAIPDSNTELASEKKEHIQNQLLKIVRQLFSHSDKNDLKHTLSGITTKIEVDVPLSTNPEAATMNKEASKSTHLLSQNRSWIMKAGDAQHGKVLNGASNGNQKVDTQKAQKFTLSDVIRLTSEEVETKTQKSVESQTGSQRLSSESKESGLFPNPKEKSGLLIKQLSSQPDRKLQIDVDISESLPNGNSNKEGKSASLKLNNQNTKESPPARLADRSQSKPIQVSSISEVKKDETVFKPLVKIETQNGNVDFEFQSKADTDSGDSEEGKSFLKLNNTSFTQLTKNSGRREFSTHIIKQLQKQADQSGLGTAKNWSQHRFVLESGDSVNVAVRQSEGIMQLQLGAGNSELNKILLQHINEIREHLQEQMNIDIDLQLQQFGDQPADLNENDQNSGNGQQEPNNGTGALRQHTETEVGSSTTRARYLGFNQNEWTA